MTISDLSTLSKVAIGLALAGFFFSFTTTYSHSVNGVGVCVFRDNAKLALGGLAIVFGAIGAIRALSMRSAVQDGAQSSPKQINLMASGAAVLLGVLHILLGLGIIGGNC